MSSALIVEILLGVLTVTVSIVAYISANRANREQARLGVVTVDAAAYERARQNYESALETVRSEVNELRDQVQLLRDANRRAENELVNMRSANHRAEIELANLRDANRRAEEKIASLQRRLFELGHQQ